MLNPQPITEVDVDGHVSFANPAAKRLFPDLEPGGLGHPWLPDKELLAACCRPGAAAREREAWSATTGTCSSCISCRRFRRLRIYGRNVTKRKLAEEGASPERSPPDTGDGSAGLAPWETDVLTGEMMASPRLARMYGFDEKDVLPTESSTRRSWSKKTFRGSSSSSKPCRVQEERSTWDTDSPLEGRGD